MWIRRILGLDPVPVPPHVFALDGERLRYACFAVGESGCELTSYESVSLPEGTFLEGPLGGAAKEASVLREAVRALIALAPEPPKEASLVLPDEWLRVTFAEMEELPREGKGRDETLRWKLQRLVPFRVEDLRVSAKEISGAAGNGDGARMLLGFAVEELVEQLEAVFDDSGVHLGQITNESASLLAATRGLLRDVELGVLVVTSETGYGLIFTHRDRPVLHRLKTLAQGLETPAEVGGLVLRDLKLTRAFVADQFGEARMGRVLLIGQESSRETWSGWLTEAFDLPVVPLEPEHLPFRGWPGDAQLDELAPMYGAAQQVVD